MKRPPFRRNRTSSEDSPVHSRKSRTKGGPRRRLRFLLGVVVVVSVWQYVSDGSVTWHRDAWDKVSGELGDYAARPQAGWRKATDALEDIGAAREGEPAPAFDITGRVVRIADGDTVSVLDASNTQHKVRLFGIDTPERDQPYGNEARAALAGMVDAQSVGVVVIETDSYNRKVGMLYRDDVNINIAMVAGGHAWWYAYYAPNERRLETGEQRARAQGLGLWAAEKPVPPWEWRRSKR